MNIEDRLQLDRMFHPRGMAFFGGVSTTAAFGQLVMLSQIRYGYQGRIYPISEKGGEIAGHRIYRNLDEVDGPVDLAAVSVPARAVPSVLRDCLKHGLAGVQVHSSGFKELDEDGARLERELVEISRQGLRIVGPNCFGLHCPKGGITMLPGSDFSKTSGSLALISQSGGMATEFGYEAKFAGLGLSKIISFGNGCDLEAVSLLEYLAEDADTQCIAAYLEGIEDGARFLRVLKDVTPIKPVIIWKGGLTPLGSRAARSHTGSMGGEARVWEGALAQAGAIAVQGLDEMMDALVAAKYLTTRGRNVAFMGGGGAIGVFSSDLASRYGLDVPTFSPKTQAALQKYFPTPGNSVANPLDTGSPALPLETVSALAGEVLANEPVDVLVMIMLLRTLEVEIPAFFAMNGLEPPARGSYLEGLVETASRLKKSTGKDLVMVLENRAYEEHDLVVEGVYRRSKKLFQAQGIPVYPTAERALRGIHHSTSVVRYGG
jgi:acyl-CoA synthetase (NDP forming)